MGALRKTADGLLGLARSNPSKALAELEGLLESSGEALLGTDRSIALRAGGLAARLTGDLAASRVYLEGAVAAADSVGDDKSAVEAQLTLAGNRFMTGDAPGAVAALKRLNTDDTLLNARIKYQIGTILARSGETSEAIGHLDDALGGVAAVGDRRMTGMVHQNRARLRLLEGDYTGASSDIDVAIAIFQELCVEVQLAGCLHAKGLIEAHSGNLPLAFELFDLAEREVARLADSEWEVQAGHCAALLAAGLPGEAAALAGRAAERLESANFQIDRAEALALKAEAVAALGRTASAEKSARLAVSVFREQGREAFAAAADLTRIRVAGYDDGGADALEHAEVLAAAGMADAALRARVLAAEQDHANRVDALLALSGRVRRAPFDVRLEHAAALAEARWAAGDRTGAAVDAAAGARLLESYQALIGLSDVRLSVRSTAARLYEFGLAAALASRRNRRVFDWMERAAIAASMVRHPDPVDDPELRCALTELSALGRDGGRAAHRRRLEQQVRTLARTKAPQVVPRPASVEAVAAELGDRVMVRLAVVEDRVVALRLRDGRLRRFDLGSGTDAVALKRAARAALTRAATARRKEDRAEAGEMLAAMGELVLAPLRVGDRPAVILAPPALADVPWSGLPSRRGMPTVVARSAAAWLEAGSVHPGARGTVVVDGPDLDQAEREALAVSDVLPGAVRASAGLDIDKVLGLMDGAAVVHVASHGDLRSDNPLFSSLRLHGGDLFAYQIQRLELSPATVVLSACHLGLGGGGSGTRLLGFTDALLAAGTGSVVASTLPVPDTDATVGLMTHLHSRMAAGERPSSALAAAQGEVGADLAPLYAAAFTCFGSG